MGHMGLIIEKYRKSIGMSRKELADGICSEKYIYLIEKGERTPSANLLKLMGDKMGVFLFGFYLYIDCLEPLDVRERMRFFHMCRINLDFISLKESSDEANKMPDFQNKPWCFEIQLNNIYYLVFGEKEYEEAISQLDNLLKEVESYGVTYIFLVNAYTLMTTCSLVIGDKERAKKSALYAYEIMKNNHDISLYEQLLTKAIVSLMGAYYLNDEFDHVIEMGCELLNIKQTHDSYGKVHFVYFFMALGYYGKDNKDLAAEYLKKAIYFLMSESKPLDVEFMTLDKKFKTMLDDLIDYSDIINHFREEYSL